MGALIDASVFVAAERRQIDLARELAYLVPDDDAVALSPVTAFALLHAARRLKGRARARAERWVDGLLAKVPVASFDLAAARVHATLSADLAARRVAVGAHDLLIAASAIELGYDLVTRELRSFPRIRDVRSFPALKNLKIRHLDGGNRTRRAAPGGGPPRIEA